ncbi:Tol-Pal system protein TolB [Acetobacteraceae bacterium]|nr:Tol-Pal system protein TolB [Acetobacteraceae bacterium]
MDFSSFSQSPLLSDLSRRKMLGGLSLAGVMISPLSALTAQAAHVSKKEEGAPEITVDQARQAPIPLVLTDFGSPEGQTISAIIAGDLASTGLFRVVSGGFLPANVPPDFTAMTRRGVRAVVTGKITVSGDQLTVEMRLWDAPAAKQLQGTSYSASMRSSRRIAHIIADVIYQRLLGEVGYFDTRVAYIALSGPRHKQTTRLAIMDYDGANQHFLTDGRWLTLEPRFNPIKDQIAFLSYAGDRPRVYLYDLQTGNQSLMGEFEGMSYAPRFSPDGKFLILAETTRSGGSDMYIIDVKTRQQRRLSHAPGVIDTSPCFSPDGSQIVFNSDRGGSPQLYIMPAAGGPAKRISYGNGRYGSPVWAPSGDLIAFTRINGNGFSLGIMHPDGTGERILTQGFTVEGASFCPNGRVLTFCKQTAAGSQGAGFNSQLATIDITGYNERVIPTATLASDPAWSPRRD